MNKTTALTALLAAAIACACAAADEAVPSPATLTAVPALTKAEAASYEAAGDALMQVVNNIKEIGPAREIAEDAIRYYKKAFDSGFVDEALVYSYVKAVIMKFNYLYPPDELAEERKTFYTEMLYYITEKFAANNESVQIDYCLAILWIENAGYYNPFQAATGGVADKIRDYAEKVYKADKTLEGWTATAILGRIYNQVPNIPFILTWPDNKVSKKYLEEAYKANPDSLMIRYFLADTLYSLDEKDKARNMFLSVMNAAPRDTHYFEDLRMQADCAKRMKDLGV